MNCPGCGAAYAPTAAYCSACGARLGDVPPAPANYSAASPTAQAAAVPPASAAIHAPAPLGTMLNGRYRVVRMLGEGAFGRVYLAKDMQDFGSALLVVKELLATAFVTPEQQRQAVSWFKHEATTLLALEHAGIPESIATGPRRSIAAPSTWRWNISPARPLSRCGRAPGGACPGRGP